MQELRAGTLAMVLQLSGNIFDPFERYNLYSMFKELCHGSLGMSLPRLLVEKHALVSEHKVWCGMFEGPEQRRV